MGQAIVKADPDQNLYLVWSSVVDAPVAVGDRVAMIRWAIEEWRLDSDGAEAAVARADLNGSSDRVMKFGWWDDETLPVMEGSPRDGWYHIRRERLVPYAEALLRRDEVAEMALLDRWDDEEAPIDSAGDVTRQQASSP